MATQSDSTKQPAHKPLLLMECYDSFPDRMSLLAELTGNAHQLAIKSGQSSSGVRTYIAGAEPTRPVLIKLANAAGVSVAWLVTGVGPIRNISVMARIAIVEAYFGHYRERNLKKEASACPAFVKAYNQGEVARETDVAVLTLYELQQWLQEYSQPTPLSEEFVRIPFYDLDTVDDDSLSAQAHAVAQKAALFCMRRDLMLNTWKLDPEKVNTFAVRNDDMYPFLRPGDWVLCDCRQSRSYRNGIYLIRRDDELVFRRAQFIDNQRVRLTRERRVLDDAHTNTGKEVEEHDVKDVCFIGRVVLKTNRVRL